MLESHLLAVLFRLEQQLVYRVKEWKKRRRLVKDMCGTIADGTGVTEKHLFEQCGMETDEENGVSLAKFGAYFGMFWSLGYSHTVTQVWACLIQSAMLCVLRHPGANHS